MKLLRTKWMGIVAGGVLAACGGGVSENPGSGSGSDGGGGGSDSSHDGHPTDGTAPSEGSSPSPDGSRNDVVVSTEGGGTCASGCPTGYTCGTANGKPVCRAASGIPMFSHIFLVMMENTSLSTLNAGIAAKAAPNLALLASANGTSSAYHGVSHPSLPNYIALTSGSTQGVSCDCKPLTGQGACSNPLTCNLLLGSCSCNQSATNLADQIETAKKTWMAFGEGMSTPCNTADDNATEYAVRHVPFVYYDDIQSDAARCAAHVVDFSSFDPATAADFTYIAPNLTDDMHNPDPASQQNITNGDKWIGPQLAKIMASPSYTDGGLIVVVWDEDDGSGGITGTDDPVPIFVISPYAKGGGFVSAVAANHYSLLATIEDGMNLGRLGSGAGPSKADTLADFFPSK
jgi:hypothetical protein